MAMNDCHLFRKSSGYLLLLIGLLVPVISQADFMLSGIPNAIEKPLLEHLQNIDANCDAGPAVSNRIIKQSTAELVLGLQALGYFNAQIEPALSFDKKCWQLHFTIALGEALQVRHSSIEITGAAAQKQGFLALLKKFPLQSGSSFNNDHYEGLKSALQARAMRLGYFDAEMLEQRVDIYPEDNVADITLRWHSGQRYLFGELQIDQQVLDPRLFRQLLSINPGEAYNLSTLQNDRIRLNETRYFELVEISPLTEQEQHGVVPIKVLATAGPASSYEAGVGYSTDTGPRLRGSYTRHRINDNGHQGEVSLLLSPVLNKLNLNYSLPWRDPRTDNLRADLSYLDEDNDAFESQRWETSLTENQLLKSGWNQSLSLTLTAEKSEIGQESDSELHLVPGISWSKLSADNLTYPSKGYSLAFALLGSSDQLISDSSFFQIQTTAKWITTLPLKLRLLLRGDFGYSFADTIDDLPTSRRFYSGGDNSIRGYEYQSLGPLENGEVIGGKHKAVVSIELERPIYKQWAVAAFVDSGNAWNSKFDAATGVGLGLRWHSPIGPLRFDIGVPLDKELANDDSFRLHFSFGAQL